MKRISKVGTVAKMTAACAAIVALGLTGCNEKKTAAKAEDNTIRIEGAFRG